MRMDEPTERRLVALAVCVQVVLTVSIVMMVLGATDGLGLYADEPSKTIVTYVVQPGDSLWKIAQRFRPEERPDLVIAEIVSESGLPEAHVQAYQQIRIPTTRRGDG